MTPAASGADGEPADDGVGGDQHVSPFGSRYDGVAQLGFGCRVIWKGRSERCHHSFEVNARSRSMRCRDFNLERVVDFEELTEAGGGSGASHALLPFCRRERGSLSQERLYDMLLMSRLSHRFSASAFTYLNAAGR